MTKFLAFGDSITAGEVPDPTDTSGGRVKLQMLQPLLAYPARLQVMLGNRYPVQAATIQVFNDGIQGETTLEGAARLNGELAAHRPDVLLLHEGVNDIDDFGVDGIPGAISALRSMIRDAKSRGVKVFVGTLLPQVPPLPRAVAPDLVVPFNAQLTPMATSEGATVVDLYSAFLADTTDWISPLDGLHPTPAGYQEMALLFFNAVKASFEAPPVSSGSVAQSGRTGPKPRAVP